MRLCGLLGEERKGGVSYNSIKIVENVIDDLIQRGALSKLNHETSVKPHKRPLAVDVPRASAVQPANIQIQA